MYRVSYTSNVLKNLPCCSPLPPTTVTTTRLQYGINMVDYAHLSTAWAIRSCLTNLIILPVLLIFLQVITKTLGNLFYFLKVWYNMKDEMIPRTPPWFSLLSPWQQAPGPWQLLAPASPTSYSLASSMPSTGPSKRSQTPLCQSWWQRRRWERPSRCWRWWPSALSLWRSHSMGCSTGPLSTCFLAPSSLYPLLSLASSFSSSSFSILEWRKEGALQTMLTTFYDWMKVFQHW